MEAQAQHKLLGKCLVARPNVQDAMFKRSVVFVFEHTHSGTAGLILNKTLPQNTHDLLLSRGFNPSVPKETLWRGGPVNQNSIVMLHSTDWRSSNTLAVTKRLAVTSDDMMLFKYSNGDTPRGYKFCAGTAIWHPQQIKMEMANNSWLIVDLDFNDIFETDHRQLWDRAVEKTAKTMIDKLFH